ncbi:CCR4-associated factor 1 [Populus alba x Populus x berolinensis]|nr:CCR4-associated factor 1 [Populus alba x Populus x berolinensis]
MSEVVPLLRHQLGLSLPALSMSQFLNLGQFGECIYVASHFDKFPGFFRNTPIDATDLTRYEDLKHNVDLLRLIQVGITVADATGNIGGTWEFNLRFDLSKDLFVS